MLLCLTSSMTLPPPPPCFFLQPPSLPWHSLFKLARCQNRDLVTLGRAVCVSSAHRFCSLAGIQMSQTKRPIDYF